MRLIRIAAVAAKRHTFQTGDWGSHGKNKRLAALVALLGGLAFASTASAGPALRINVKNASQKTITEVYVVIQTVRPWGSNHIAGHPLPAGKRVQVFLEDGVDKCVVDLRIVTEDGVEFEQNRVRLCGNPTFTYHGRS